MNDCSCVYDDKNNPYISDFARTAWERGYRCALQTIGWTLNCKETPMPTTTRHQVLFCNKYRRIYVSEGYDHLTNCYDLGYDSYYERQDGPIVYWMEIPKLPEGENGK